MAAISRKRSKINAVVSEFAVPSVWGSNDCVRMVMDYIRIANPTADIDYPDWIKDDDGELLSEKRAIATADSRFDGGLAAAWESFVEPYCDRANIGGRGHNNLSMIAIARDGTILIRGADHAFYGRQQWGILRHHGGPESLRSVWIVRSS